MSRRAKTMEIQIHRREKGSHLMLWRTKRG